MSRRKYFKEENRIKTIATVFSVVLVMTVVIFALIFNMYNKKLRENARNSLLELGKVNAVVPNQIQEENIIIEPTSITQDKGINEVKDEEINNTLSKHDEDKIENIINNENNENNENNDVSENLKENENKIEETNDGYIAPEQENFEPSFIAPVSGEIIKDYASDSLVYSKTLDEWTTHFGIDIKSEKMSVVVASEAGIVESIKNDPRYRTYNYYFSSWWI
ncbi:MAG: hypothetical protein IKM97_00500 [Clostridia bacterium]|nr:hypothetical protein [Clostridia bacterium]